MNLYPLLFSPLLHEKVWGGSSIEQLKGLPNSGKPIGESWEIYFDSIISNGAFAGISLKDFLLDSQESVSSHSYLNGEFPLLVKFLDAREWLSVQVHPDDSLAQTLEQEPRGKTECWYILHAEPDAQIQYGLKKNCSVKDYAQSINEGRNTECLEFHTVKTGDFIYVPAGAIHAIGPGIVLYELQQTSDITYRLYDWDRVGLDGNPRETHVEKGLLCINPSYECILQESPLINQEIAHNSTQLLIEARYFILKNIVLVSNMILQLQGKAGLLTNIGASALELQGDFDTVVLSPGTSSFIPAGVRELQLVPSEKSDARILFAQENQG